MAEDRGMKNSLAHGGNLLAVFLAATVLALLVRGYRLEKIQYVYDEWLAIGPGPPVSWSDGPAAIVRKICANAPYYVSSAVTITHSSLMQFIKLFTGLNPPAIRWWYAVIASLGVGMTAYVAARLYRPWSPATLAVVFMGVFSVSSIVMGQFICHYAFFYLLTGLQVAGYLFYLRTRRTWSAYLIFALLAYGAQLVSYLQIFVTAGLFIASLAETGWSRKFRTWGAWLAGVLTYGALSCVHLFAVLLLIPWQEGYRWYMAPYYPLALLGKGDPATVFDGSWIGYFLTRLYDLFNYHWSLVFNPGIYQPLEWNWVSLPFIMVAIIYIIAVLRLRSVKKRRRKEGGSSALSNGEDSLFLSPRVSFVIALVSILTVCLTANRLLLLPFGGIRQSIFLAPLFWLVYGGMVRQILLLFRRRGKFYYLCAGLVTLLAVVPFILSLPALYRDRVSRVDLDKCIEAVDRFQPERILASHDSIEQLELAMLADTRFSDIQWPGYPHESDVLDAELDRDKPYLQFKINGARHNVELVEPVNFPQDSENIIYVDMFLSHDARFEGSELLRFYRPLDRMISNRQTITPLLELPGNAPNAIHQSIYWPPNAFYLYRVTGR